MKRKFYASVLLITCCLPFFLLPVIKFQLNLAQREMKERLEKQSMVQIVVEEAEINWVKQGKEIWYQGKMFDIKSITRKGNAFHISGLFDDKETALKKKIQEQHDAGNQQGNIILVAFMNLFNSSSADLIPEIYLSYSQNQFGELTTLLPDIIGIVPTPPPQFV